MPDADLTDERLDALRQCAERIQAGSGFDAIDAAALLALVREVQRRREEERK